ncbi:DsbA family protein [Streptomyces sp. NPDC001380]|uniref:DsbA family protein n=1 Tax=Streptomyces sp. NPDC001380 TaxID=3364566 RepID=UPI0036BA2680
MAVVVALGAFLTGCDPWGGKAAAYRAGSASSTRAVTAPFERVEADGATITVGAPFAPLTVRLYEDPRCPYCGQFERTGGGPQLAAMLKDGRVRVQYVMASFLDGRLGGEGSHRAVNALRAAAERGRFAEYHALLYAHQPEESEDGFTDAYLLELAGQVDGLRSPSFDAEVKGMRHRGFVAAAQAAYEEAGAPGTPTMEIAGARLPDAVRGALYDRDTFARLMRFVQNPGA